MSICEHHLKNLTASNTSSTLSQKGLNTIVIQDEIEQGLSYRKYKREEKDKSRLPTKKFSTDVPFKLCREEQRKHKCKKKQVIKKKTTKPLQPSLLERNVMSQKKYMDLLAGPNIQLMGPPKIKKRKLRCNIEPCPLHVNQLALPKKSTVFMTWKEHYNVVSTDMIVRYQSLLHTDKNLEPKEAANYYQQLDKQKRKVLKAKRRLFKKTMEEKEKGKKKWVNEQIDLTIQAILQYIKNEPLLALNYNQLLLSDGILEQLEKTNVMKKPSRSSKSDYEMTIIEVSDKMAIWMDVLNLFVDIQAIDSEENIAPLTVPSTEEEDEGEEDEEETETESISSSEESRGKDFWEETEMDAGKGGVDASASKRGVKHKMGGRKVSGAEILFGDLFELGEGGEEAKLNEFLDELDLDLLDKLIQILADSPEEFLETMVGKIPGVRYSDILKRLRDLKEDLKKDAHKNPILEDVLIDWARKNNPDQVDQAILKKIHEIAPIIGDFLIEPGGGFGS